MDLRRHVPSGLRASKHPMALDAAVVAEAILLGRRLPRSGARHGDGLRPGRATSRRGEQGGLASVKTSYRARGKCRVRSSVDNQGRVSIPPAGWGSGAGFGQGIGAQDWPSTSLPVCPTAGLAARRAGLANKHNCPLPEGLERLEGIPGCKRLDRGGPRR